MSLKRNNKGAQGIGTLIIFIAMILVAAVAAGVLIQTASSLQSKSLDVGRQSQEKITTDIEVVTVTANGTIDHEINDTDYFTVTIRLGSGSVPIKLGDMIVKLDSNSGSQTISSGVIANQTNYGVTYISNSGAAVSDGYLSNGDLAELTFMNLNSIGEQELVTLRLLSKNGAVRPVYITTPSAMTQDTTFLFP